MATFSKRSPAITVDNRTDADKANTALFVVALDKFMSGWGGAPGRSYFAVPCASLEQAKIVQANMRHRSEMTRVRLRWASQRIVSLRHGDHLSIRAMDDCERFYTPGGFAS